MSPILLAFLSASALPCLAILAVLLRKNIVTGKGKFMLLFLGLVLLSYAIIINLVEHIDDFGIQELVVSLLVGAVTLFILATFNHRHHHKEEGSVHGIVISEAFHSLIDGAVIGATHLVNPLIGGAATIGIVVHEFPKIVGTLAILRSLNLSVKKTILYGALAQVGAPIAALFVYLLGRDVNHEQFHLLEIASLVSLATIILWIIFLEIRYHIHHKGHSH
jgi:zinc transporter ZupT